MTHLPTGAARVQDVVFQYRPDQGMLQGVSLTVPAGEPPSTHQPCLLVPHLEPPRGLPATIV